MYCSSCGVVVAQGLPYCNYCGAKLSSTDSESKWPDVKPELLVSAIAGLFILGLFAIIMLMGVLRVIMGVTVETALGFSFLAFILLLFLEGMFIRLLFRGKRGSKLATPTFNSGGTTRELDAVQARSLPDHITSVTEHTTRAFEPIHTKRRSE